MTQRISICPHCRDTYPDFDVAHVCSRGPYAPKLKAKMNERIKELLEQVGVKFVVMPKDTEYEKFAELIVRECAELFDKDEIELTLTERTIHNTIKEHFGVEDRAIPILSADEQALFAGIASSKLFTIEGAKKQFGVEE